MMPTDGRTPVPPCCRVVSANPPILRPTPRPSICSPPAGCCWVSVPVTPRRSGTTSAGSPLLWAVAVLLFLVRISNTLDAIDRRQRERIANRIGKAGDAAEALRLLRQLLPDQQHFLGPLDPDTLRTRHDIAAWTGDTGDASEALRLFQQLLPDQERVLGQQHPHTLRTRREIAALTRGTGCSQQG
jgi:hypothetical protein